MWVWTLNWSDVRDDLVIGSCPMTTADIDRIREETGVSALLSLQSDACREAFAIRYEEHCQHGERCGLAMINAPMRDFDPPDQRRSLPIAVHRLTALLATGHKVYIHCTAGINRAPLTVLAFLTFVETMSPDAAIAHIRSCRSDAEPSWEAYHGCRQDLVDWLKDDIQVCAYHLSHQHLGSDPESNWFRAETLMIRQAFTSPRSLPGRRLDPNRP